jgi:hypothetical protein
METEKMKFKMLFATLLFGTFTFSITVFADTIVLKNGLKLQGTYKGGSETSIKFETSGAVQEIAVSEIESLTFTAPVAGATADETAVPIVQASGPVKVPEGTMMMIKIDKAISTAAHSQGSVISAVLDADIVVNGQVAVQKGATLYGTVLESIGGKRIGNQRIIFQFNSIMIKNEKVPISTSPLGAEGGKGGALRTVAGAALIGGAVDGKKGAKTGALIGAGASVLAGGRHIQIPAGTLAEIPLDAPLVIQ